MMQKVKVMYKHVDGAHFFVSGDKKSLGLCVAHQDLATAYNAVSPTLKKIFKENYGKNVDFKPELSLPEFQQWLETIEQALEQGSVMVPTPETAGMLPWKIMAEAA